MISGPLLITGTGTDVGKTIVTATVAINALRAGQRVAVIKPGQTGVGPADPGDVDVVRSLVASAVSGEQLAGLTTHELARFTHPLAPAAAARLAHLPALSLSEVVTQCHAISETADLTVIEGAGGLLVNFSDHAPWTVADLAREVSAKVVVVVASGLGTLHHTAATVEAANGRDLDVLGLIIGAWPRTPDLAACANLADLDAIAPLIGALPENSGVRHDLSDIAARSLGPELGGRFDAADFAQAHRPEEAL
ncbi:MAG TPA: dethiobiotin synthase [Actinobacteria bacterium]|nr:dethiobiotin synthase [Actinomycetota bacterium]HCK79813.1 dethiobiotin synthase [Actinomycetota bacterium]